MSARYSEKYMMPNWKTKRRGASTRFASTMKSGRRPNAKIKRCTSAVCILCVMSNTVRCRFTFALIKAGWSFRAMMSETKAATQRYFPNKGLQRRTSLRPSSWTLSLGCQAVAAKTVTLWVRTPRRNTWAKRLGSLSPGIGNHLRGVSSEIPSAV